MVLDPENTPEPEPAAGGGATEPAKEGTMQRWRGIDSAPGGWGRSVVTIGVFDGVHRGHQQIIGHAVKRARERGLRSVVVTFDPHPSEVVRPGSHPAMLTEPARKAELIEALGVDALCVIPFTLEFSRLAAEAFVHDVLAGGLGIRHAVVGYDFRFGYQAAGDAAVLAALGDEYGFGVTVVEPVTWRGEVCSSSRIRKAVAVGDVVLAHDLLGHPFIVQGRVVRGDRRGRDLGYPTANLRPPCKRVLWPKPGIYSVRAAWERAPQPLWRDAVASLGVRPTFGGTDLLLEVHLLDRAAELYGERLCCAFIERLRDEQAFASVEELKAQMAADCASARDALASAES